jgi:hypothetical protein
MTIDLDPELEAVLIERARREGIAPEALVLKALRERFLSPVPAKAPRADLKQLLRSVAKDCGVSLPNSALSREEIYD